MYLPQTNELIKILQRLPREHLQMSCIFIDPTYACALGHYAHQVRKLRTEAQVIDYLHGDYLTTASKEFGITEDEAIYIFSPKSYKSKPITPADVLEHINDVKRKYLSAERVD